MDNLVSWTECRLLTLQDTNDYNKTSKSTSRLLNLNGIESFIETLPFTFVELKILKWLLIKKELLTSRKAALK